MHERLSPERRIELRRHLSMFQNRPLRIGTGCSGTDLVNHIANALQEFWCSEWSVDVLIDFVFSVEKDEVAAEFIKTQWPARMLFRDMDAMILDKGLRLPCSLGWDSRRPTGPWGLGRLGTPGPRGHMAHGPGAPGPWEPQGPRRPTRTPSEAVLEISIKGAVHDNPVPLPVPDVDMFICGFECDSISSLNRNAASNRSCGTDQSEKTGNTLAYGLRYVQNHRPPLVIWEIVKQVFCKPKTGGLSVFEHLQETMMQYGYQLTSDLLHASGYGSPQRRERAWIICCLVSDTPLVKDDAGEAELAPFMHSIRHVLSGLQVPPMPLTRFLLSEEMAQAIMQSDHRFQPKVTQKAKRARSKPEDEEESYKVKHLEAFQALGLPWPPPMPDGFLDHLPMRSRELGYYYCEKFKDSPHETVP